MINNNKKIVKIRRNNFQVKDKMMLIVKPNNDISNKLVSIFLLF